MKKATVKVTLNGGKVLFVTGKVKDTRKIFGRDEYLIHKGTIDDFWVSSNGIVMFDKNTEK